MDHVSNLFQDKDKFLKNIPTPMQAPSHDSDNTHTVATPAPEPSLSSVFTSPEPQESPSEPILPEEKPQTDSSKAELVRYTLYKIKDQVDILLHLLDDAAAFVSKPNQSREVPISKPTETPDKNARILEGSFNGEKMVSDDGEIFDVPANYASKSKIVEGDRMKLTIPLVGSFIYKQIAPIERRRVRGELISGGTGGQWQVSTPERNYKVLTASITFHKGRIGDEVVLLVPESGISDWGAVDHIIHREF